MEAHRRFDRLSMTKRCVLMGFSERSSLDPVHRHPAVHNTRPCNREAWCKTHPAGEDAWKVLAIARVLLDKSKQALSPLLIWPLRNDTVHYSQQLGMHNVFRT